MQKTLKNPTTMNQFKESPRGNLKGNQVDLKQVEIGNRLEEEYRLIRNNVIVLLAERRLRYSDIEKLKVKDIDDSFMLIRVKRGVKHMRIMYVSISKEISQKIQLLMKYKDADDYIFTKNLIEKNPISQTRIADIVEKHKKDEINNKYDSTGHENGDIVHGNTNKTHWQVHTVERVCGKYLIYKNNRPIEGLVINTRINALRICDVLNADDLAKN